MRPLLASLFLGVVWAMWHLPLIFTRRAAMEGTPFVFLLLDLPASAVLFTWLFLRPRRGQGPLSIRLTRDEEVSDPEPGPCRARC